MILLSLGYVFKYLKYDKLVIKILITSSIETVLRDNTSRITFFVRVKIKMGNKLDKTIDFWAVKSYLWILCTRVHISC